MQQPARNRGHPAVQRAVHPVGDAAAQDQFAHQYEKRNGDKQEPGIGLPDPVGHDVPQRRIGVYLHEQQGQGPQRTRNVQARHEEHGHQYECYGYQEEKTFPV